MKAVRTLERIHHPKKRLWPAFGPIRYKNGSLAPRVTHAEIYPS